MAKSIFNEYNPLSVEMIGMHGTVYTNFAVSEWDLIIGIGSRFDGRVIAKLDSFANFANVVHLNIDPTEICQF